MTRTGTICVFSGDVNGRRRYTTIRLAPDERTLDQAEAVVMNTWSAYKVFYKDATEDDYNADVLNRTLFYHAAAAVTITEQDPK